MIQTLSEIAPGLLNCSSLLNCSRVARNQPTGFYSLG